MMPNLAAVISIVMLVSVLPAWGATSRVGDCPDAWLVTARGSGQEYGESEVIDEATKAFRDTLANVDDVRQIEVPYPAWGVSEFIKDIALPGADLYLEGVESGVIQMTDFVRDQVQKCADETAIALLGYSQGAIVVQRSASLMGRTAESMVVSVQLLGNPLRRGDNRHNRGTGSPHYDGIAAGVVPGVLPLSLRDRARDWCVARDPVCEARPAPRRLPVTNIFKWVPQHTQGYTNATNRYAMQAGVTAALRVLDAIDRSQAPPPQPPPSDSRPNVTVAKNAMPGRSVSTYFSSEKTCPPPPAGKESYQLARTNRGTWSFHKSGDRNVYGTAGFTVYRPSDPHTATVSVTCRDVSPGQDVRWADVSLEFEPFSLTSLGWWPISANATVAVAGSQLTLTGKCPDGESVAWIGQGILEDPQVRVRRLGTFSVTGTVPTDYWDDELYLHVSCSYVDPVTGWYAWSSSSGLLTLPYRGVTSSTDH